MCRIHIAFHAFIRTRSQLRSINAGISFMCGAVRRYVTERALSVRVDGLAGDGCVSVGQCATIRSTPTPMCELPEEVLVSESATVNVAEEPVTELAGYRLTGRVALVTGGIRGIGAAISEKLASHGATIAPSSSHKNSPPDSRHQSAPTAATSPLPTTAAGW
jgi:3-oxoacyl-ACP reductase-like protein